MPSSVLRLCVLCLLLAGCTTASSEHTAGAPVSSTSSSSLSPTSSIASSRPLEQVPSALSVEHFANMRLEGSELEQTAVLSETAAYTRYAIQYQSNDLTVSGILNLPHGEGPFPLLLLNHGYIDPDVYTRGRGLKREQDYLARQGFAVLHSDFRGHAASDPSPDTREVYDAGLEYSMDVVNAINAVRKADLPQIDANRIGMMGHSMGGGVTLNILTAYPNLVDAAVLYAPVHADAWQNFTRWRDERDEKDRTREVLGSRRTNPAAWDALSSLTHLHQIETPILLFQGTNDADVPPEWSDFLAKRLQEQDKDIRYVVYQGEAHEFIPQWPDFIEQSAQFFRERLHEK